MTRFTIKIKGEVKWLGELPKVSRDKVIDGLTKAQVLKGLQKEGEYLRDNAGTAELMGVFRTLKTADEELVEYFLDLATSGRTLVGKVGLLAKLDEGKLKEVLKLVY